MVLAKIHLKQKCVIKYDSVFNQFDLYTPDNRVAFSSCWFHDVYDYAIRFLLPGSNYVLELDPDVKKLSSNKLWGVES